MLVLGLQGSPRLKGNTAILLSAFLDEAQRLGARTHRVDAARKKVAPCRECGNCDRKGFCIIEDDMQEIFHLLREADIIVMAAPVFFYGVPAQLKALIDRTQTLWARRYVHHLSDPGRNWRRGLVLSVGATKGKNLFDGIVLTAKYFFDAVGAGFDGSLTYRRVEKAGEIKKHPTALNDARQKAREVVTPLLQRKRILFVSQEDACRSQMARAYTQHHAGGEIEALSAGVAPAEEINPLMEEVMGEKGIDMAFRKPRSAEVAAAEGQPHLIVSFGQKGVHLPFSDVKNDVWDVSGPAGESVSSMRAMRDNIRKRVEELIAAGTQR